MSLIDIVLQRQPKTRNRDCRPTVEVLEERQCLSVAPPTLTLTAVSPTQVKLTWTNVANEAGYRVFRWDGVKAVLVTTLNKDVVTLNVGQLAPNTLQWFAVEAFDISTQARSAWKSIQTPAEAISAPTNFRVVGVTTSQVNLAWNNAAGALGYRVFGWDGARAVLLGTTTPTVPAFTVSNLSPGITYWFYVQAFNNTNSATTGWISARTTSPGITAPTNFKAVLVNASTASLSWNDVVTETGYRVFRWDGNSANAPVVIANLSMNTTGFQATGLLPGRTYSFYIQAFNATNFANTGWVSVTTAVALPLQPPTQVTTQVTGPSSVKITWVEPARAVGYRVAIWTGASWTVFATVPAGTNTASISGLASFRTYWFMVQSFTADNAEVAYSTAVFANL
jgi:hypothetical protein